MQVEIKTWMYRESGEFVALFISVILLLATGYLFSQINVYVAILILLFAVIAVRLQQAHYLGNSIRVHQEQFPELFEIFQIHAKSLGITRGAMYINQDPTLNAFALGVNQCTVVLSSSLVEQLNQKELSFVIGHELGHFKAGHTKVTTFLMPIGSNILTLYTTLVFGFWNRKSEYTADKCGILLTKDIDSSVTALIKLAIGGYLFKELNIKGYTSQLQKADSMLVKLSAVQGTHPLISSRIRSLLEYWNSHFKEVKNS